VKEREGEGRGEQGESREGVRKGGGESRRGEVRGREGGREGVRPLP